MDLNTVLWVIGRSTGMVALLLLSAAAAMGLALSMKASSPRFPRWLTTELHRYVTILGVVVTVVHLGTLWLDSQAGISLLSLVVPFISDFSPIGVGLGVISFEIVLVVWLTTRLRDHMRYRTWQIIHRAASVGWVLMIVHGIIAGTDTGRWWAVTVYTVCAAVVGGLLVPRMVFGRSASAAPATPTRADSPA